MTLFRHRHFDGEAKSRAQGTVHHLSDFGLCQSWLSSPAKPKAAVVAKPDSSLANTDGPEQTGPEQTHWITLLLINQLVAYHAD